MKDQKPVKKARPLKRISTTKVKRIEKGILNQVEETRGTYLSKEIEKYKDIKVIFD